jgi:hypothetical protein
MADAVLDRLIPAGRRRATGEGATHGHAGTEGNMHRGSDGWKPHRRRRSTVAQDGGRGTAAESADMGNDGKQSTTVVLVEEDDCTANSLAWG